MKTRRLLLLTLLIACTTIAPSRGTTEHQPLLINSDAGFTAAGFEGSGTETDPYVIASLAITSKGGMSNGIEIEYTHAHFVVRNCLIHADYVGVSVHDVSPGTATIEGNVITGRTGEGGGIVLGADGVRVLNNVCTNFTEGIHTNYADDCLIAGNRFSNNTYHGISLRYSSRNIVVNNTIAGNKAHGIFVIRTSRGNRIYNNTVSGNSAMKSYDWDTDYHFEVKSQAADEGGGNTWYSTELKLGNHWSDYGGAGAYRIDGSANAADSYPSRIGGQPSGTPQTTEPTNASNQQGVPGFPIDAIIVGVALSVIYLSQRKIRYTDLLTALFPR